MFTEHGCYIEKRCNNGFEFATEDPEIFHHILVCNTDYYEGRTMVAGDDALEQELVPQPAPQRSVWRHPKTGGQGIFAACVKKTCVSPSDQLI